MTPLPGSAAAPLPVLHAVTNDEIVHRPHFLTQARAFMQAAGARGAVQLRAPRTEGAVLFELAMLLAEEQRRTGAWLVLNDRLDIALGVAASAVQLTGQSMTFEDARRVTESLAIGVSVHDLAEGTAARQLGATWGVVNMHTGEDGGANGEFGGLALARQMVGGEMPIVVIGGVTAERVPSLRAQGVYGVAAIRGIWDDVDAGRAAIHYLSQHDRDGGG
jgi:thiamine-phosphate pyrophosphorylase